MVSAILVVEGLVVCLEVCPQLSVGRNSTARYFTTVENPFNVGFYRSDIVVRIGTCTSSHVDSGIGSIVSSYGQSTLCIFIATLVYAIGVSTRSQVFKYEDTIVVVVSGIIVLVLEHLLYIRIAVGLDDVAFRVFQYDFCTIDRIVFIGGVGVVFIQTVFQRFALILDLTHDISLGVFSQTVIGHHTAEITKALLAAPVRVQTAVT